MCNFKQLRNCKVNWEIEQLSVFYKNWAKHTKSTWKALRKFRKIPSKCFRSYKQFNRIISQCCDANFFEYKTEKLNTKFKENSVAKSKLWTNFGK